MEKKKYSSNLFWWCVLTSIARKWPLFVVAAVLSLFGPKYPICVFISAGLIILMILFSIVAQLVIKHTLMKNDDPNLKVFADACMSDDWREEWAKALAEEKKNSKKN